jgi:fructan beta-fructosidase
MQFSKVVLLAGCLLTGWAVSAVGAVRPDVVVADFEGGDYGGWRVEGEAFGDGPAAGALPGQMAVGGYAGKGLVNSFVGGDGSTGVLTSPVFRVERDYLVFLVGGGGWEGETCMELLAGGEVVRTVTGPNTVSGGSEELSVRYWDMRELRGREVVLRVVDKATGGWGHINIDHIVQSDVRPEVPVLEERERVIRVDARYLVIPIQNGVKQTEIVVEVGGEVVRRYSAELALRPERVDWHAFLDLAEFEGREAVLIVTRATEAGFGLLRVADEVPGSEGWYNVALRPQFHFSQSVGWNNDPNGMVYLDGEWHLFFQHNPVGWNWGNMTWGHAVSRDLVHWEQLPEALYPKVDVVGDCFSGGATVDRLDTAGWKQGDHEVMVVFLTDTGAGESLAYSADGGRTFTPYEGNPVVRHKGRDPKVIWYAYGEGDVALDARAKELGGHWVMAVYDEDERYGQNIAFYTSTDLKSWTEQSHLKGYFECPELFELPVRGRGEERHWVVFAADARYALGQFNGRDFTPVHAGKHRLHWGDYYASQTFDNAPNGRRIQVGWVRVAMPGMPFNQTFSFPHELSLRDTAEGVRMFAEPVVEIEHLRERTHRVVDRGVVVGRGVGVEVATGLLDIRMVVEPGEAERIGLALGGDRVVYDVRAGKLGDAALGMVDGRVSIRVLVDRPMLEVCGNEGRVFMTSGRKTPGDLGRVDVFAEGGDARLLELEVHELKSIW